ncbi:unnamed protein product [Kuraishia capsulata CBS 1993]|uniref:Uncharacterized protein n=1 Tax=Kuraishia capsulata CBS 1993 TaxID=1382522 RepID=W6MIC0_9ASCO|nr:uncharacterized protein KUCA_T00001862001 [Kuraishia capsulata CBS 1993]CDK25891.1 unnamed protein product [Kuraishia capsulata CBS 1993]
MTPSLEDLVIGCYASNTFGSNWRDTNLEQSDDFRAFTIEKHCFENLKFLVEIVRYENLWNQMFEERHVSVLKCKKCGPRCLPRRISKNSEVSCLSCDDPATDNKTEPKGESDSDAKTSETLLLQKDDPRGNELTAQWHEIMEKYIYDDAPYQINLPDDIHGGIIAADRDDTIQYHSPVVLLGAQRFTLELLRENAYSPFIIDREQPQENGKNHGSEHHEFEEHVNRSVLLMPGPCGVKGSTKDYQPTAPAIAPVERSVKKFSIRNQLSRFRSNTLTKSKTKTK